MITHKNIRPFILKWEGGLSRDPSDTASINPAPFSYNGATGYHTNKGITYSTFSSLSPKLGYPITADNFFVMPDAIWSAIFKVGYWDPLQLDGLKSQVIADTLVSWGWGSGVAGAFSQIKKYLATKGISVSTKSDAIKAFNTIASGLNEQKIFLELVKFRENFFVSINQPKFLKGWLNRLNEFRDFGLATLKKKES